MLADIHYLTAESSACLHCQTVSLLCVYLYLLVTWPWIASVIHLDPFLIQYLSFITMQRPCLQKVHIYRFLWLKHNPNHCWKWKLATHKRTHKAEIVFQGDFFSFCKKGRYQSPTPASHRTLKVKTSSWACPWLRWRLHLFPLMELGFVVWHDWCCQHRVEGA